MYVSHSYICLRAQKVQKVQMIEEEKNGQGPKKHACFF